MKIQPMQQIADHLIRSRSGLLVSLPSIDRDIRAVKWRLRHGRVDRTILANSAVNSLVAKRMVKKQQMRWSPHGAHMLMQVRTALLNGELRDRLRTPCRQPEPNVPSRFKPKPPLLRAA